MQAHNTGFVPTTQADYTRTALVSWAPSPDGTSLLKIYWSPRGLRGTYSIVRSNLSGEDVTTIARRTTEAAARTKANEVWLRDKPATKEHEPECDGYGGCAC